MIVTLTLQMSDGHQASHANIVRLCNYLSNGQTIIWSSVHTHIEREREREREREKGRQTDGQTGAQYMILIPFVAIHFSCPYVAGRLSSVLGSDARTV